MTTSSLYPTHKLIYKVPQLSIVFQTQNQPQTPGRFSKASQIRAPIGRCVTEKGGKADIEYLFEHGEVIKLLHFGWCINTPGHYKDADVLPNSVAGDKGNLSGISP